MLEIAENKALRFGTNLLEEGGCDMDHVIIQMEKY